MPPSSPRRTATRSRLRPALSPRSPEPPEPLEPLEPRLLLATFPVTTLADDGPGSLRQAFVDANAAPGPDTIAVSGTALGGTVRLASPLPALAAATVLAGPLTIDGTDAGTGARGVVVSERAGGTRLTDVSLQNFGGNGLLCFAFEVGLRRCTVRANGRDPGPDAPADAAGLRVVRGSATLGTFDERGAGVNVWGNAGDGIRLEQGARANVYGGRVGGAGALGNGGDGISVRGEFSGLSLRAPVRDDVIHPTSDAPRVVGNAGHGVFVSGLATAEIVGALVGTDSFPWEDDPRGPGPVDVGNGGAGVYVTDAGSAIVERSRVAFNRGAGVVADATPAATELSVAVINLYRSEISFNGSHGVALTRGGSGRIGFGTSSAYAGSTIRGNRGAGVYVEGANPGVPGIAYERVVYANDITANAGSGVEVVDAEDVRVGGSHASLANAITGNGGDGVTVRGASRAVEVGLNMIDSNGRLGIDLGGDGVTPNDPAPDADGGPNGLQNYPVITSARLLDNAVTMAGSLHTTPDTAVTVRFYYSYQNLPAAGAQGRHDLGATEVRTDAAGNAAFEFTRDTAGSFTPTPGDWVTATATAAAASVLPPPPGGPEARPGATSEFSTPVALGGGRLPVVRQVYVGGSHWTDDFRSVLYGGLWRQGYPIGADPRAGPLPASPAWTGIDRIGIEFYNSFVTVDADDLVVTGLNGPYRVVGFDYDQDVNNVATWKLDRPIGFDRVTIELDADAGGVTSRPGDAPLDGDFDGRPGGDYRRTFSVTPGDATGDGRVNALDLAAVRVRLGTTSTRYRPVSGYSIQHDIDGNGRIDSRDLLAARRALLEQPPQWPPA